MRIKRFVPLALLLCLFVVTPHGASPPSLDKAAASCSQSDVQSAINSAGNGDRIVVPAGKCAWKVGVSIQRKNVTVQGAGAAATIITLNSLKNAFELNTTASRVTGFGFIFPAGDTSNVAIRAQGQNFRVDHNRFESAYFATGVWADGTNTAVHPTGVVDHNEFVNTRTLVYGGDITIWKKPTKIGNPDQTGVVYVEDNTFTFDVFGNAMDSGNSANYVFRYNTVANANVEAHSHQRNRMSKTWEIYNNTFNSTNAFYAPMFLRGGTGVVFENTITGNFEQGIRLDNARSWQDWGGPNGRCDGTSSWDGNLTNGWPCRDQIGRGQEASGPFPQPQASEPAYFWSNTFRGDAHHPVVVNCVSQPAFANGKMKGSCADLVAGRDYFTSVSTPRPGYSPYTYPHPLATDPK